jgi:hypothetical protein
MKIFKKILIIIIILFIIINISVRKLSQIKSDLNILFYSTHRNTFDEIKFAFKRHNKSLATTKNAFYFNKIYGYESFTSFEIAIENVCNNYDLIIICDTIRIGIPFFERINKNCKTKFALQIVDRVDRFVKHKDKIKFLNLIKKLTKNLDVYWLLNNIYDIHYLNKKEIYPDEKRFFFIPPYGVIDSNANNNIINLNQNNVIYVHRNMNNLKKFVIDSIGELNSNFEIFSHGTYGGPAYLSKQKVFIYFPYQPSTMKVFDNAVNNVFTAIPTPYFFEQLVTKFQLDFYLMPELLKFIQTNKNWTEYFDVYNKKYYGMYLTFNNWIEFKNILTNDLIVTKIYHLAKMKEIMKTHQIEVDLGWRTFFNVFNNL